MIRSLLVVLALVVGLIALVPRVDEVKQPPVDAAGAVAFAVKETRLPLLFPQPVPDGWSATQARYAVFAELPTWQVGWTTPAGSFVGIKQAVAVTLSWIDAATVKSSVSGSQQIAGRTWEVRVDEHKQTHLVSAEPVTTATGSATMTTVVSGTGGLDELRLFIGLLAPAAPSS